MRRAAEEEHREECRADCGVIIRVGGVRRAGSAGPGEGQSR